MKKNSKSASLRARHKNSALPHNKDLEKNALFPDEFRQFMLARWKQRTGKLPAAVPGFRYFAKRRQIISQAFLHDVIVVPTGREKVRANDTHYPFRPGSDFYYLTGSLEPDGVLVMVPNADGHDCSLFVEPNPGRKDETFFTDRDKGELWVGPRSGIPESAARFGMPCRPLATLPDFLRQVLSRVRAPQKCHVIAGIDAHVDKLVGTLMGQKTPPETTLLAQYLGDMRLIKDAHELRALKKACDSTRRGFEDVIERLHVAANEREVEGVFNLRARMEGNAVGYNTIAASGEHACVLHWSQNFGALRKQDLLLLDAGVEGHELYTADVTRTLPISGRFSGAQRQVYDLVLKAQQAALAEVRPGRDFLMPHRAAMVVLAHGLEELGVLPSAEEALDPKKQYYRRYTLHGVSHMLGLDVHDCAQARNEVYRFGALKEGMVLTVEPGLYFQKDDLTVPARLRGIGVRIEDDVVVTSKGYRMLSVLPRDTDAVEAWMQNIWSERCDPGGPAKKRDASRSATRQQQQARKKR